MIPKNSARYARMSGAGNTFVIVDCLQKNNFKKSTRAKLAKKICANYRRKRSDGMIFLDPAKKVDFAWDFYNSDGTHAEMCGNASRCVSRFYNQYIKAKKKISFKTSAGLIRAQISKGTVRVQMPKIKIKKAKISVLVGAKKIEGMWLNTGVPHFVIKGPRNKKLGALLRKHKAFGPKGTNVTFIEKISLKKVSAVTFERGVEDFTQACGTGAVAASAYTHSGFVSMPGGNLKIQWDKKFLRPSLTGDAKIDFEGLGL